MTVIVLPEGSVRSRKGPLVLLVALVICVVTSCVGAFLVYGEQVVYRRWNSVRVWASPEVEPRGVTSVGPHDLPHWFAAMHRHAQRNIKMKTRNDYTLGMVLVVLPRESEVTLESRGRGGWSITESTGRGILVETGRISVGRDVFSAANGRLVLIDPSGVATQHAFESKAQNATEMQSAVNAFLAARE
jgi:hypothetical protein